MDCEWVCRFRLQVSGIFGEAGMYPVPVALLSVSSLVLQRFALATSIPSSWTRELFLILIFVLALCGGCRVETVRSLSRESSGLSGLFYELDDSMSSGTLAANLSFGMGFESIEPPQRTSLAGFGGAARRLLPPNFAGGGGYFTYCLPYRDVDLAPRVKVLTWQGNDPRGAKTTFAIISVDVVAVPSDVSRKIVEALSERYPQLLLDHGNVQVVASHTHAGPAGLTENPFWSVFACDRYSNAFFEFFKDKVLNAFSSALGAQKPVISTARRRVNLPGFNKTRFEGMKVDERLLSLSFSGSKMTAPSRQGEPCLQIFAVHPTVFGQTSLTLSSDIVGHAERELTIVNKGQPCVYLNGVVGNADAVLTEGGIEDFSQRFAEIAFNTETGPWQESSGGLEFGARVVDLPSPKPNLKACGVPAIDTFVSARILNNLPPRTKMAYVRIGKTLLIFYPGEPVSTVAASLEKAILEARKDVDVVQILAVSNDYLGYVVDFDTFDEKSLESCSTLYGRRIADTLLVATVEMVSAR
jgi:Neutral/alkaline non-lysosomal ceramidase, N-terminal